MRAVGESTTPRAHGVCPDPGEPPDAVVCRRNGSLPALSGFGRSCGRSGAGAEVGELFDPDVEDLGEDPARHAEQIRYLRAREGVHDRGAVLL